MVTAAIASCALRRAWQVEACEKKLAEASTSQDRVKTRHGRLTKVFVDIRAGIEHMSDKLEPVKLDQPAVPVSDDTIVDVMYQCESKLLKMCSARPGAFFRSKEKLEFTICSPDSWPSDLSSS